LSVVFAPRSGGVWQKGYLKKRGPRIAASINRSLDVGEVPSRVTLTIARRRLIILSSLEEFETIAQEVSGLGQRASDLEKRLKHIEEVNTGLEEAALTTARAMEEISAHWDKVYEAMRRSEAI
jgi:hypothetical protein